MTALIGMKEICQYMRRSEASVLMLIRTEEFPAIKVGGIWESDTEEIDLWRRGLIRKAHSKKRRERQTKKKEKYNGRKTDRSKVNF